MVARQLITDAEAFAATARLWTQNFASQALAFTQNAKVRPLGTVALARGFAVHSSTCCLQDAILLGFALRGAGFQLGACATCYQR